MKKLNKFNILLWIIQGLLALFFAVASGMPKLLLPAEALPMPIPLSTPFIRFIGAVEVLGAIGLILPGLLRIRPSLTVYAGVGLVLLTLCAAVYQLMAAQPASALFAVSVGMVLTFVAYGRTQLAPFQTQSQSHLQPA